MQVFPSPLSPPFLNLQLQPTPPGVFLAEQSRASLAPQPDQCRPWVLCPGACAIFALFFFKLIHFVPQGGTCSSFLHVASPASHSGACMVTQACPIACDSSCRFWGPFYSTVCLCIALQAALEEQPFINNQPPTKSTKMRGKRQR